MKSFFKNPTRYNNKFFSKREISQEKAKELFDKIGKFIHLRYYNSMSFIGKIPSKEPIDFNTFCRWMSYHNLFVAGWSED